MTQAGGYTPPPNPPPVIHPSSQPATKRLPSISQTFRPSVPSTAQGSCDGLEQPLADQGNLGVHVEGLLNWIVNCLYHMEAEQLELKEQNTRQMRQIQEQSQALSAQQMEIIGLRAGCGGVTCGTKSKPSGKVHPCIPVRCCSD